MSPSNDSSKTSIFSKIWRWVCYYFCFCKGVFFASGLLFSDKLIDYSILGLLITYLINPEEEKELMNAAILAMTQKGVSALLEIVMVVIARALFARFMVITVSTLFYIGGLVLLISWVNSPTFELISGKSITGIFLLGVGQAGVRPLIREFIVDQFRNHKRDQGNLQDKEVLDRAIDRKNLWCRVVWCFSALAAFVSYHYYSCASLDIIFRVAAWATGCSLILFLFGTVGFYHSVGLADLKAFLAKIKNFKRKQDKDPTTRTHEGRQTQHKKKLKYFRKMFFLWTTFLLFGLVLSAGRTFFPWQGQYMKSSKLLPYFVVFQSVSRLTISFLFDKLCSKWVSKDEVKKKDKLKKAALLRIWIGMLLSIPCFIVAWKVEVRRLRVVNENNLFISCPDYELDTLWLLPQFCLLGFMEGLAQDGLDEFMFNMFQFPESRKYYVSAINALVIGLGSFSNMLSVYVNKELFGTTVNDSRLDEYYRRLTIVTSVNFVYYSGISVLFYYKSKNMPETEMSYIAGVDVNTMEEGEGARTAVDVNTTRRDEISQTARLDVDTGREKFEKSQAFTSNVDIENEVKDHDNRCSCLLELLSCST